LGSSCRTWQAALGARPTLRHLAGGIEPRCLTAYVRAVELGRALVRRPLGGIAFAQPVDRLAQGRGVIQRGRALEQLGQVIDSEDGRGLITQHDLVVNVAGGWAAWEAIG
jgi:hypothetical protein